MRIIFWVSWLTFLLVILRMQYQISKVTKQMSANRTAELAELKRTAGTLEEAMLSRDELKVAIAENTEITKQAADTATKAYEVGSNHVNEKLEQLGLEKNSLLQEQKARDVTNRAQADSIQETGEDSNRMLKDEKP